MSHATDRVAQHYDERTRAAECVPREADPLFALREANNAVKSALIDIAVWAARKVRGGACDGIRVFDMACGRGGDLSKWKHYMVDSYVGVDVSPESIREARKRARTHRLGFPHKFFVQDLARVYHGPDNFNIVSLQFALHYFMRDAASFAALVYNVATALHSGGMFVCTFPRADRVLHTVRHGASTNSVYSIQPSRELAEYDGNPDSVHFGMSYKFSMSNYVQDCEEYVVNPKLLEKAMLEHGMKLKFTHTFSEFAQRVGIRHARDLDDATRDAFDFYCVYAFQKQ